MLATSATLGFDEMAFDNMSKSPPFQNPIGTLIAWSAVTVLSGCHLRDGRISVWCWQGVIVM